MESTQYQQQQQQVQQQNKGLKTKIQDYVLGWSFKAIEKGLIPDKLIRLGIRELLRQRVKKESQNFPKSTEDFLKSLAESPIAVNTAEANTQHYEVPTEYYEYALGARKKYSSCLYEGSNSQNLTLNEAEERMLALYCERAQIEDGQSILELGCGWGSFTLFLAEKYPHSQITAISNSNSQREYIEGQCQKKNFKNVKIITKDINQFEISQQFDRIVSIEMFEHMRNYKNLLEKVSSWIKPEGYIFIHIFCHKQFCYPFDVTDESDWMAKTFFTGGIMPNHDIFKYFDSHVKQIKTWTVNGKNYSKTLNAWLRLHDSNKKNILQIFQKSMTPAQAEKYFTAWRLFYLACEETFGYNNGEDWYVAHYLLQKKDSQQ